MVNASFYHPITEKTHQFFETEAKELAEEIINTLAGKTLKKEPAGWSSYLPSLPSWLSWESAGNGAGYVYGATYGQELVNQGIDVVAIRALQNRLGKWGAQGAAESLKVVAGNWLVPYLPTIFSFAGTSLVGAVGPLLGAGASYLVSFVINNNDPKKLSLMDEKEIKEFLDENKIKINKALLHLAGYVLQQEIYAKLFECKTNADVKNLLEQYVIHRQADPCDPSAKETLVLKDGYVLNASESKQYKSLMKNFTDESDLNFGGLKFNQDQFKSIIRLLGVHTAKASSEKAQDRLAGDLIQCKDGIYCRADGSYIDQPEAEFLAAAHRYFHGNFQVLEEESSSVALSNPQVSAA